MVLAAIALAAMIFVQYAQQSSFAHPILLDSSPKQFSSLQTPPNQVSIQFSEAIELPYSKMTILAPDGSRADTGKPFSIGGDAATIGVGLKPGLPEGVYTVTAKVLSAVDGHVIEESFTFGIGVEAGPSGDGGTSRSRILSPAESASRFPGFLGQVMVVGAAFGTLWLWKPINKVPWLSAAISDKRREIDKNMMRLAIIGAGLVLGSGLAMIIAQANSIEAGISDAISTKFGNVWLARMMQASILMVIAVAIHRKLSMTKSQASRGELYALLIVGIAVIVTSTLIAHAAATGQSTAVAIDFVHNVAASIWIGGLIFLGFIAIPKIVQLNDSTAKAAALSLLIPRFSIIVVAILGLIVITGPLLLFLIEDDLSLTVASVYGRLLIVKLSLAGVMIAIGAYHQFVIQKRTAGTIVVSAHTSRTGKDTSPSASEPERRIEFAGLSKSLKVEAVIGIGLLLVVSFMTNNATPAGEFRSYSTQNSQDGVSQAAFAQQTQKGPDAAYTQIQFTPEGGKVRLGVNPFTVGQNQFKISFVERDGRYSDVDSATLKFYQAQKNIGPIAVDAKKNSEGVFRADAAFGVAGTWKIMVEGTRQQSNASNILVDYIVDVKPSISSLEFSVKEYKTPEPTSPLYPVYDKQRQLIWVGDTTIGSGRLWQFDIQTGSYTMHRIPNASLITVSALADDGRIWYADPTKSLLGVYDPASKQTRQFTLPERGIISGIVIDNENNVWVTVADINKVVRFSSTTSSFTSFQIPTPQSNPVQMALDSSGAIWFAEAEAGKIAKLDPATGKIEEFAPGNQISLGGPTAIFPEPAGPTGESGKVYVAEHASSTISVYDTLLQSFKRYRSVNSEGLPFGMAMDSYGNLWYAEHQIDWIAVLDPVTGQAREAKIPTTGSFVQYLTSDDAGRIWFAEQRGSALGSVTIAVKPGGVPGNASAPGGGSGANSGVQQLGFSLADVAGPGIAAGIVISALFYSKSALDLKRNTRAVLGLRQH